MSYNGSDNSVLDPDYEPDSQSVSNQTTVPEDEDNDIVTDEPQDTAENKSQARGRKRVRDVSNWQRNMRKRMKNSGQEYIGVDGMVKRAKLFSQHHCKCRFKCSENISAAVQEEIFHSFWRLGSWEQQTGFLLSCSSQSKPRRPSKGAEKRKLCSNVFQLNDHRVCREFFRKTIGISEGRLHRALLRKRVSVPCPTDQRGKHGNHRTVPSELLVEVRQHIESFPRYRSHYCRRDSIHRMYFSPGLNLNLMYNLYVEKCKEDQRPWVKKWCYAKIFNEEFNISFRLPTTDTCSTCDRLSMSVENSDGTAKKLAETQEELHLRKADLARDSYKTDTMTLSSDDNKRCIVFDLQKTMPTPHLNTNKVYYMRQLWTYNLAVHDTTVDHAWMYMWDETVASRGSSEVASCLLHYCKTLPQNVKHLTAYSDCCGGQNRNENIALTWMYIAQSPEYSIEMIDHKFFEPGHSYNVCDQDFGLIEKKKRHTQNVWNPEGWRDLVACSSKKFTVVKMEQKDMKSLGLFKMQTTCRKKADDGANVAWLNLKWMSFSRDNPYIMSFKHTLSSEYVFRCLNFRKVGKSGVLPELGLLYSEPRALKKCKVSDLRKLLVFVPPVYHDFYNAIRSEADEADATESISDLQSDDESSEDSRMMQRDETVADDTSVTKVRINACKSRSRPKQKGNKTKTGSKKLTKKKTDEQPDSSADISGKRIQRTKQLPKRLADFC